MPLLERVGAAAGGDYWLRPLDGFKAGAGSESKTDEVTFQRIKSLADLEQSLSDAKARDQGAMLDFYADWCVECLRMERNTFHTPQVQALLDRMQTLQADVTPNDSTDQELMRKFGIIGPPAILFFDAKGQELPRARVVGFVPADAFAAHLTATFRTD